MLCLLFLAIGRVSHDRFADLTGCKRPTGQTPHPPQTHPANQAHNRYLGSRDPTLLNCSARQGIKFNLCRSTSSKSFAFCKPQFIFGYPVWGRASTLTQQCCNKFTSLTVWHYCHSIQQDKKVSSGTAGL